MIDPVPLFCSGFPLLKSPAAHAPRPSVVSPPTVPSPATSSLLFLKLTCAAVCCLLSAVCCPLSAVRCLPFLFAAITAGVFSSVMKEKSGAWVEGSSDLGDACAWDPFLLGVGEGEKSYGFNLGVVCVSVGA